MADRAGGVLDGVRAVLDLQEGRGRVPVLDDDGIERRPAGRPAGSRSSAPRPIPAGRRSPCSATSSSRATSASRSTRTSATCSASRRSGRWPRPSAATGPFDIVDVFRRSELCVAHAREAVAAGARCLWLQLGVVNWEAAADRPRGRSRRRHGPLHGDRGAGPREPRGAGARRARGHSDEEPHEHEDEPDDRDQPRHSAWRRRISIATDAPVVAVVADAAAPGLVAGDVRVLRLERLVARPRARGPGCSRRRSARRPPATGRGSRRPRSAPLAGVRRPAARGRRPGRARRWPGPASPS